MRFSHLLRLAICLAWLAATTGASQAAPLSFGFTATVDSVSGFSVGVGQTVSGSYTFETTTSPTPGPGDAVRYINTISFVELELGGDVMTIQWLASPDVGTITVTDETGSGTDAYVATLDSSSVFSTRLNGFTIPGGEFVASLLGIDHTLLGSSALPLTPPSLAATQSAQLQVQAIVQGFPSTRTLSASLDSLYVVPEPGTLLLLTGGLAGLGLAGRPRRS